MQKVIPHNRPTIGEEEICAAVKVMESGHLSQGTEVALFENEFCEYLGLNHGHAVAVSSGSAALYMAIRALDMDKNQRNTNVAIPAYSCSALRNAVLLAGKKPLYADVKDDSPNIDLTSDVIKEAGITIACHIYGMPERIDNHNVIEDCAQAIGATINGKLVGTQTEIGIFSFYATKPITSGGEGGMVVSKNKGYIDFIKDIRDFDMKNDNVVRFNMKMTDLQASVGRIQLKRLPEFEKKRHYLADRYEKKGIPLWRKEGSIEYRGIIRSRAPERLMEYLKQNGVQAILPITESELLCVPLTVPRAYALTHSLVSIPLYPSLTDEEQDTIIGLLNKYVDVGGNYDNVSTPTGLFTMAGLF